MCNVLLLKQEGKIKSGKVIVDITGYRSVTNPDLYEYKHSKHVLNVAIAGFCCYSKVEKARIWCEISIFDKEKCIGW